MKFINEIILGKNIQPGSLYVQRASTLRNKKPLQLYRVPRRQQKYYKFSIFTNYCNEFFCVKK